MGKKFASGDHESDDKILAYYNKPTIDPFYHSLSLSLFICFSINL